MKIDFISMNKMYANSLKIQQKPAVQSKGTAKTDRFELSGEAVAFSTALKAAKQAMETNDPGRLQKLNSIKHKIDNGTYSVSGEDIAEKMLER